VYNIETFINGTKYIIDEITIRDLSMINDDMIIGLRFYNTQYKPPLYMTKELLLFHIKIMLHISQRYESMVKLNKFRIKTLGLKKPMTSLKMTKK
jgi:hypothetical protein